MKYEDAFKWIDTQAEDMLNLLREWVEISSYSLDTNGLKSLSCEIVKCLEVFGEDVQRIDLPVYKTINARGRVEEIAVAPLLTISKRLSAEKKVLLVCHMDTVYPRDGGFSGTVLEGDCLRGPGVTDAKAGIIIMLTALQALERSGLADKVGWRVVINADEEIGSLGSATLLKQWAKECDIGLVFEPCLSDGHLVGARKGSGNFTFVAKGVAAHAGREPSKGRNAITALAKCIIEVEALDQKRDGLTVNVGVVNGGQARNVVPDLAIAQVNARINEKQDAMFIKEQFDKIVQKISQARGVKISWFGDFFALPKVLDNKTLKLFKHVQKCGEELGLKLDWYDSGGVCDGNRLSEVGLPTVDTLGALGGNIHSHQEYLYVPSLVERTKLATLCLLRFVERKGI